MIYFQMDEAMNWLIAGVPWLRKDDEANGVRVPFSIAPSCDPKGCRETPRAAGASLYDAGTLGRGC